MTTQIVTIDASKPFTDAEVQIFEERYNLACKNLAEMVKQKKAFEEKEKEIKEQLEQAMDAYGIKSLENEFIKFTRIAENAGKQTIDVDAMKKKEPNLYEELLADYPKTTGKKKAYVKFETK